MKPYLFLFSITPVQAFISQARKTYDLFAGSHLLSALCRAGMQATLSQGGQGAEIIFPRPENQSLPNRFVASLSATPEQIQAIGSQVEAAVRERFWQIATESLAARSLYPHPVPAGYAETPKGLRQQLQDHLQLFWVAVPQEQGYAEAFAQLERAMGATKNLRLARQYDYQVDTFKEVTRQVVGELGRKCSIDGQRNVKFYRPTLREQAELENGQRIPSRLFITDSSEVTLISKRHKSVTLRHLQAGEGLSAVSFVKRVYEPFDEDELQLTRFPSTAGIALMELHATWYQFPDLATQAWELHKHIDRLDGDSDDQLYYEENLTQTYFQRHGLISPNSSPSRTTLVEEISRRQKELAAAARKQGLYFNRYYAIIHFDGDSMGKWLGGAYLSDPAQLRLLHRELSRLLGDFAEKAAAYLVPPKGRAIYAGGDDFLGLINLEYLFPVLQWLRDEFDRQVAKPLLEETFNWEGKAVRLAFNKDQRLTMSAGVVVAHYKTPLGIALEAARRMEAEAKQAYDQRKDCLGLSVLKRSGEVLEAVTPWYHAGTNVSQRLEDLVYALKGEHLSGKFIHSLFREFGFATEETLLKQGAVDLALIHAELQRLMQRAATPGHQSEALALHQQLLPLLASPEDLATFINLLFICDFINRNTNGTGEYLKGRNLSAVSQPVAGD